MITGIHHVAYVVENIDTNLAPFEAMFETEPTFRMRRDDDDFTLETALYLTGDHFIEFISPVAEQGWPYEHLSEHGEGFFHIGYEVDDLDAAIRSLREAGIGLVTEEPQAGVNNAWRLITIDEAETVVPTQLVQDDRTDRTTF